MGRKRLTTTERVRRLIAEGAKPAEIAEKLKLTKQYVYQISSKLRMKKREKGAGQPSAPLPIMMKEPAADPVNHPAHYKTGGIETIDFIEAKKLNYNLGNVVKYLTRADHKGNRVQDLEKAMWYLKRELERPHQPA